jgi:hypothetical protein
MDTILTHWTTEDLIAALVQIQIWHVAMGWWAMVFDVAEDLSGIIYDSWRRRELLVSRQFQMQMTWSS